MRWFLITTLVGHLLTAVVTFEVPEEKQPETISWKETQWSQHLAETVGGIAEFRLPDGSRVDVLETTETEAIAWEVEWDLKWTEAVGQSLYYALSLDNQEKPVRPGIWLLKKSKADDDYIQCLAVVRELRGHGIDMRLRVADAPHVSNPKAAGATQ